ncbi:hypothetical protein M2323_002927 [Rhodoblastus acidophilus]|uniref:hypothetical protein n=1 Tax=Rhodoblastus acidophilus TaxID=1074 RepID=UPI002225ACB9|nr:hypothetical protein [Rhodoblastus acidophilus]MCW2284946.1 hypothetical protein [Rhodoblastus acidophilus]MCW2333990.1 hypothetical protein [Rhodoblastus acidophilus]
MSKKDNTGKSPIKRLFSELLKVDAILRDPPTAMDDTEYGAVVDRHWALRELIASHPVGSLADLAWISQALSLETDRDPEFTNDAPGSARALAMVIANGALQLAGAAR